MRDKEFQKLWEIRFLKIYNLEKEGFLFYRNILRDSADLLNGTRARGVIEGIMRDELRHVRIARELLRLVRSKNIRQTQGNKV